jgi:hypothetical protein
VRRVPVAPLAPKMAMFIESSFYFGTDYPLMDDTFVKILVGTTPSLALFDEHSHGLYPILSRWIKSGCEEVG